LTQLPSEAAAEQVLQPPVQAFSQQTPSTQNLLAHWPLQLQAAPSAPGVSLATQASAVLSVVPPSTLALPSVGLSFPPSTLGGFVFL